ncbi:hypothetical protein EB46_02734, partial [Enterococcus faecalis]
RVRGRSAGFGLPFQETLNMVIHPPF